VSSTSPSHRIFIYFSDILPCRFNSFTRSLKVSTLPILEGKRLAGNLAPQTEHEREIGSKAAEQRWSRFFEQNFRVAKWNLCRGYAAARSGSSVK
jgi:hypothetical protein